MIIATRRFAGIAMMLAVFGMAGAYESRADNGPIRMGRVELYPTWSAVGIEVSYAGDDARRAEASFTWRRAGEKSWRNGVDMTFDRERKLIWASIWPLEQGESIEVRLELQDPRYEQPLAYEEAVATKTMVLDPLPGARRYYVSPNGNDFKPGTRRQPFRTLRHAAAVVRPGEAILALSGVYQEGDLFSRLSGTPGAPIVIAAAPGEKPILDGGVAIPVGATGWEALGDGLHAIDWPALPATQSYVAVNGERIFHFRSMEDVRRDIFDTNWGDTFRVERGWYFDSETNRLFVRLRDGMAPSNAQFQVAAYDYGALLANSHHVVLRGFEIRNYGQACVRISEGATGCVIYENELHNAQAGVFVYGETTAGNAVWRNRIYEPGLTAYAWGQNKRSGDQRQGITGWVGAERGRMGRGMSFCHNEIRGWFDGIMPGGWNRTDRLDLSRDMDIMFNDIADIGDDAIEIDSGAVNQRVHGNKVRNAFAAFAMAAVEKGPVYVTRNEATFFVLGFKLNVGGPESMGWAYTYHNSLYCVSQGDSYGGTGISFPNGATMPIANKIFKNNAMIVDGMGIRYGRAGSEFDYNAYWPVPGQEAVVYRWESQPTPEAWETVTYSTLAELHAATGQEAHGIGVDPQFVATPGLGGFVRGNYGSLPFTDFLNAVDSYAADLRLQPDSPCIDAGVVIRGINEDFAGTAPDMGAFEHVPAGASDSAQ